MSYARFRFSTSVTVQQKLKEIFRFITGQILVDSDLEFANTNSELLINSSFPAAVTSVSKDGSSAASYNFLLSNVDASKSATTVTLTGLGISSRTVSVTTVGTASAFTSSSTSGLLFFKTAFAPTTFKSSAAFTSTIYAFADLTATELIVAVDKFSVSVYSDSTSSGLSFVTNVDLPYTLRNNSNIVFGGLSNPSLTSAVFTIDSTGLLTFSTNGNLSSVFFVDSWSTTTKLRLNNISDAYSAYFDFAVGRHGIANASYTAYPIMLYDGLNGIELLNISKYLHAYLGASKPNCYYMPRPVKFQNADFDMLNLGTLSSPRILALKRG